VLTKLGAPPLVGVETTVRPYEFYSRSFSSLLNDSIHTETEDESKRDKAYNIVTDILSNDDKLTFLRNMCAVPPAIEKAESESAYEAGSVAAQINELQPHLDELLLLLQHG
jgi:hypothetical protein